MALSFPEFLDPVAIEIGPLAIRWYALAYIAGFILGWRYAMALARRDGTRPTPQEVDEFLTWAVIAVILGGRLGYVLFYKPVYYLSHPLDALAIWQGGMSFHGGVLGLVAAGLIFARRRGFPALALGDLIATVAPIGLFFGRLANFVNKELWGRTTDVPWGVVFHPGEAPRHPSQLYEAALEGVVLFVVLWALARIPNVRRRTGTLTGAFLIGYGLSRIVVEFFREPDAHLGYLWGGATMGQLLSIPMVLLGLFLVWRAPLPRPVRG